MNNIFFYETEIGIIGIRENNKSITDIFFSKVDTNNNKNPIPIIIPCHRVIGSNGKLVGYAGGVNVKEKLLNIEKIDVK